MDSLTFVTTEEIFAELGRRYETVLLAVESSKTSESKQHLILWQHPVGALGLASLSQAQLTTMLLTIGWQHRRRRIEEQMEEEEEDEEDDDLPV